MLSDLLFLSRRQLRREVYCLDVSNASDSSISQLKEKASHILNLPYRLFFYNQQFRPVVIGFVSGSKSYVFLEKHWTEKTAVRKTAALLA